MFDNVAKEPGSYNHHKKCREGCYLLPLFLLLPPPTLWLNVEQNALILMAQAGSVPSVL